MKTNVKIATLATSLAMLFVVGGVQQHSVAHAATFQKASSKTIKSKTSATYNYAKKMLAKNANGFDSKAATIFSKKAYPASGAADGYSDFLLGLKANGYKFTSSQKSLIRKNLVLKSNTDPAVLSKAIVGLKSIGYNPAKYRPYGSKKDVNLVAQLYKSKISKQTTSTLSQVLIALSTGSYSRPKSATFSKTSLAKNLASLQQSNNGWAYDNQLANVDTDTTAMAVTALARSKSSAKSVTSSMAKGQTYLKAHVSTNGAFGYNYLGKTILNANSTAEAIIAYSTKLSTAKYANSSRSLSSQTASPMVAMLSYVNSKGTIKDSSSDVYGVGQVNLAIGAYKQAQQHRSVYTIK